MLSPARPHEEEDPGAAADSAPAPFLKWAGGKRQLLPELLREVPDKVDTYYEPFVGGGALFFSLAAAGRFRRAVLADCNSDLIDCYRALQTAVDSVIAALRRLPFDRERYYEIRALNPATLDPAERAARTIYLNKAGFNGLYRVNSRGQFNVPYGKYTNPTICNEPRLRADARVLRGVTLECRDFAESVAPARPGDFVYFDPPYVPLSSTASFTAYAKSPFGPTEQARLALVLRELGQRSVPALLSNSFCPTTRALYKGLRPWSVHVRRSINSVGDKRGPIKELLVKSFSF